VKKHLFVGGLVAAGFDASGRFLLTVSHTGRGVFAVGTWERVARDSKLAYPESGFAAGIGPIEGQKIKVTEGSEGSMNLTSPDGLLRLVYDSGSIEITDASA
jgi:hypothetical protein